MVSNPRRDRKGRFLPRKGKGKTIKRRKARRRRRKRKRKRTRGRKKRSRTSFEFLECNKTKWNKQEYQWMNDTLYQTGWAEVDCSMSLTYTSYVKEHLLDVGRTFGEDRFNVSDLTTWTFDRCFLWNHVNHKWFVYSKDYCFFAINSNC